MPADTARMLRTAALVGGRFAVTDLAVLLRRPASELAAGVEEAMAAGILTGSDPDLAFRHLLIQQALYESMPAALRTALHAEAARELAATGADALSVAQQLSAAKMPGEAWVRKWLIESGPALATRAPQLGAEILRRELDETPSGDEAWDGLMASLVWALLAAGSYQEAARQASRALTVMTDPVRQARLGMVGQARAGLVALADELAGSGEIGNAREVICLAEGDPGGALGAVRDVLDGTAPVIGYVTVVEAHLLAGLACRELGDQRTANQAAERALALAEADRHLAEREGRHPWSNPFVARFPPKFDDPDQLREGIEDNLRSLRLGQLAAVNLRLPGDGRVDARFDDQLAAMVAARDEGLIAGVGLSNVSLEQLRHAAAGTEIVCVQNLFHLADRRGTPVLEECLSRGIAFVPFCPLGWPRGQDNPVLTSPVVIQVAARLGLTPAQVALQWLLQLAPNVLLIPGTGSVAHLRQNLAAEGVTLDDGALRQLDGVAA